MGLPLPDDAAAAVARVVEEVRDAQLPEGVRDVRWVRLDGLHLTLRFLGPTPAEKVDSAAEAVLAAAQTASGPIRLELSGAGAFPRPSRPRTLWIGIAGEIEDLTALAAATHSELARAGWPPEARPFRPHLTLARSDGMAAGPVVAARLTATMADRAIECTLRQVGLFESVTGRGPARYVPVELTPLGPEPGAGSPVYHQTTPDPP